MAFVPSAVAVGDFNKDARLDIVVADWFTENVSVLLQYNRGALKHEMSYASGGGSRLTCFVVNDINNDNRQDMVVANYATNNIGIFVGYGNGSFQSQTMINSDSYSQPSSVTVADFNNDSQVDIAIANHRAKTMDILIGNGNGTFAKQLNRGIQLRAAPFVLSHGDFNNDRRSEIVVAYDSSDDIDILSAFDDGSFTNIFTTMTGRLPTSIAVGDFNNDARLDIVVTNGGDGTVSILFGCGNGSFVNQTKCLTLPYPAPVAVADFNNDTQLDIVVGHLWSKRLSVLLGYGNGSFANRTTFSTGLYTSVYSCW